MHADLTNTVCTKIPDPSRVRKKQAAGNQNKEDGEADEGESSAAPVDDEHRREKRSKQAYKNSPPRTPKKQTDTTDALQQQKGRQKKTQEARNQPYVPQKQKKRKKKERKGGVDHCLVRNGQIAWTQLGSQKPLAVRAGVSHPERTPQAQPDNTAKTKENIKSMTPKNEQPVSA